MKAGREHRVPLSPQVIDLLGLPKDASTYIFPRRADGASLSTGAMERVLDRMKVAVSVHGFRSMFRDRAGKPARSHASWRKLRWRKQ